MGAGTGVFAVLPMLLTSQQLGPVALARSQNTDWRSLEDHPGKYTASLLSHSVHQNHKDIPELREE
jgi:hypothetical protein